MKKLLVLLTVAVAMVTGVVLYSNATTEEIHYHVYDNNGNLILQGTEEIEHSKHFEIIDTITYTISDWGNNIEDLIFGAANQVEYWFEDTTEFVLRMFD